MNGDGPAVGETVEYDPQAQRYRAPFYGPPSEAVIEVIAAIEEADLLELEPLYLAVDPDALDRLLSLPVPPRRERDRSVTFRYHGYAVTVRSYGIIEVEPPSDEAAPRE